MGVLFSVQMSSMFILSSLKAEGHHRRVRGHGIGVCVLIRGSLLILLCVCDGGDCALAFADITDTRPLTIHRLLPQRYLKSS